MHRNATGENIHHGVTKDVSIGGVSVLLEQNIYIDEPFTLLIQIPNQSFKGGFRVLEIKSRMIHTVYDGSANKFRAGIEFKEFVKKEDRPFLETPLKKRQHPIPCSDAPPSERRFKPYCPYLRAARRGPHPAMRRQRTPLQYPPPRNTVFTPVSFPVLLLT